MANKTQVPIITFSATSPLLTSINNPYFVRATLDDSLHVDAIAAVVKYFEWRSVVAMYVDNVLGNGIMLHLSDALQDVKVYRSVISLEATDDQIYKELNKLMTEQTRVFVVHVASSLGFRVLQKAREIGMMEEGYVWILSNGITDMLRYNSRGLETVQGVLGVRTQVPQTKELKYFRTRWKRKFVKENPSMEDNENGEPNVFALWAYDSITALAMAVEKTNRKSLSYGNGNALSNNKTDLGTLGLESSTFEIINVVGNKENIIGFWSPSNGLVNAKSNNTIMLGEVIWPGKSTLRPAGWQIPTNGKKLRVGVPVKKGFLNLIEAEIIEPSNNTLTIPKGYTIDIFEAALKKLPYSVIPQYIRLEYDEYNNCVCQLRNGKLDALVGDVTITADRSLNADFTIPFTESGVSMMVPLRYNEIKNIWVINDDFRGPPHHQIGTSFWFSFSTMVFAHREKVVSNLARFVVVVWCFVVLVLTQSYTANLTSVLMVKRLHPTATTVEDLIRNEKPVGYQRGAFVKDILQDLKFSETQLKPFDSAEECDQLFSNGTIVAAFDEVAYLKAIISKNCSKYAMVEPFYKTAGFGFAFPKNSPLTDDFSRAILNVTQGEEMEIIENKWFKKDGDCPDPRTAHSYRLSLSSFWGLFLIAGIASFLAFLVFVALFLYEHRHTLCDASEGSLWRKLKFLFRILDEKDMNLHTFKNNAVHNVISPITQCTSSPSTVQMTRPWPRSMSLNRNFELRRVSLFMSEERFTTLPKHDENGESDIESGAK
ncbi:unnamed protein product [Microthlaspi erraticum]|uniref:Glutamate receptor n=1 Tax=Microthlaspi erraticum TaxID=1685480 RepID=A0A6D2HSG3_9BRAS|nr:unnamed protein product [Microthlaspi erraticum]